MAFLKKNTGTKGVTSFTAQIDLQGVRLKKTFPLQRQVEDWASSVCHPSPGAAAGRWHSWQALQSPLRAPTRWGAATLVGAVPASACS